MRQLNDSQLRRLEEHKYSCMSVSLMDPLMQKWWCWLVEQCPLTLAPNLITITGLAINIFTSLILVYYSPDAKQEVPRWACFLCAFGLFVYQSLDAIDGKQARRTGTSSPLGELFDHGCDSLSTVFVSLGVSCSVRLGALPYWMFFQCMMAVTLFYCAHWQTYVSGTLRFGYIDVTEAQFGVMAIHLVSVILGPEFWAMKVPVLLVPFRCLPTIFGVIAAAVALFNNFKIILIERGAGRNGSTVAGTSVLSPVVPLSLILVPAVLIAWKSPTSLFLQEPTIYLLTFGCVAARVTNRLVVAHMTKSEMAYSDASLLGPAALFLNQYFNCPISEKYLLYCVCAYVIYDLVKYCRQVCLEICEHLNIMMFTIVPKYPQTKATSSMEKNGSSSKYMTRSKSKVKNN
ncbi:cholinephosphotransferase 1-like isoform X1 [Penaeus chinensis]|uniref:cholinephosphotransferase 1-like isoform X1 n=1 Tax=Penaeus chinensis TaxID=139456 RepID=UPI001FB6C9D0|nr:cholinephosphotransferase 1-like isoform X1 [Penaeus chinensis]XP_047491536.1 cholinephosphotransferase 1-like isoform X1 [Penaeus chinensis]XP_047491537.1 cholinephosphotransferase 1-like isoform X1 [Penaeus chinensis]XP_047491538.1 cholinephosphotransferase 1-like isoform X1 [Penaeus chinensis]XP_047491539.1 cholinephosphotransferase 1-like isoform X1 [Penaeus chinensis]XP_047491540.1 cholinephosphotransferase 1-like isoform X1 [Penaeus chinensis]XP_047491541.1 cholinephosphotransferase 